MKDHRDLKSVEYIDAIKGDMTVEAGKIAPGGTR